jgi:hypothetical protein
LNSDRLIADISERYRITTGPSELDPTHHATYKIVNKYTGIVEAEISIYSRAVALAVALDNTANDADELLKNKSMRMAGKLLFDVTEAVQSVN